MNANAQTEEDGAAKKRTRNDAFWEEHAKLLIRAECGHDVLHELLCEFCARVELIILIMLLASSIANFVR